MSGTGRRRGEPAAEEGYRSEQFSFVDDEEAVDVIDWLAFTETRTERREERKRRSRNRTIALLVTFVLVVGGGGGYALWRAVGDDGAAGAGGERAAVLFQVRAEGGGSVANAVLFRDGDRGSMMVIPGALRLPAGGRQTTLRTALGAVGPTQSRGAVSELLGVRLDGSWILEEVAFTSMLDRLGGVRADVDTEVVRQGSTLVRPGEQRLTGKLALAYATYRAGGESQRKQAARFERVLQSMFRVLPTDPLDASRMLDNLGVVPDPELSNERLGAALGGLAANVDRKRVAMGSLPVRGDGVVDPRAAGPVVRELLGEAARRAPNPGPPRVFVQDATGRDGDEDTPDAQQSAGVKVIGAGHRYINGGQADDPAEKTTIEVSDKVKDAQQTGEQMALTLGVPTSAVTVVADQIVADIIVTVGRDFLP